VTRWSGAITRRPRFEATCTRFAPASATTEAVGFSTSGEALRRYQAHLFEEKKLAVGTVGLHVAALRFVFVRVLKRRELKEELPTPKRQRRLPTVLSILHTWGQTLVRNPHS